MISEENGTAFLCNYTEYLLIDFVKKSMTTNELSADRREKLNGRKVQLENEQRELNKAIIQQMDNQNIEKFHDVYFIKTTVHGKKTIQIFFLKSNYIADDKIFKTVYTPTKAQEKFKKFINSTKKKKFTVTDIREHGKTVCSKLKKDSSLNPVDEIQAVLDVCHTEKPKKAVVSVDVTILPKKETVIPKSECEEQSVSPVEESKAETEYFSDIQTVPSSAETEDDMLPDIPIETNDSSLNPVEGIRAILDACHTEEPKKSDDTNDIHVTDHAIQRWRERILHQSDITELDNASRKKYTEEVREAFKNAKLEYTELETNNNFYLNHDSMILFCACGNVIISLWVNDFGFSYDEINHLITLKQFEYLRKYQKEVYEQRDSLNKEVEVVNDELKSLEEERKALTARINEITKLKKEKNQHLIDLNDEAVTLMNDLIRQEKILFTKTNVIPSSNSPIYDDVDGILPAMHTKGGKIFLTVK